MNGWGVDAVHLEIALRLVVALAIGGLIGLERSYHGRPAGFRTHALVCLSTSLLMLITVYEARWFPTDAGGRVTIDPTRMAQGIMTGIGFLGAGAIIQSRGRVGGLATAASIWVAGAVGMACGLGYYSHAFLLAVVTAIILALSRFIEGRGGEHEPGGHQAKRDAGDEEEERG